MKKNLLFLAALSLFLPSLSFAQSCEQSTVPFRADGFVSFWTLDEGELIPSPIKVDLPVSFEIKKPQSPGYVELKKSSFTLDSPLEVKADLSFFYICENTDSDCSKTYLSAQIKLSGEAKGFCGAYFSKEDFFPFPVLFCSAYAKKGLIGLTLHRKAYLQGGKI